MPQPTITVTQLTCARCGYIWLPRIAQPRQCPKCKSAYFDTPKQKESHDAQDPFERLSILERAQFLADSSQRRHAEALERHESRITLLEQLIADQQRMQQQLLDVRAKLQTTLDAMKDMLNRPNGH